MKGVPPSGAAQPRARAGVQQKIVRPSRTRKKTAATGLDRALKTRRKWNPRVLACSCSRFKSTTEPDFAA
eukprot:5765919-Pleurochrysis_carterae.AAC.1